MVDKLRAYSVFGVIFVALILNFWFGVYTAEAASNAMFVSGQNSASVNQTFREDRELTNTCIEAGQTKAHCLCLTSIYKHKLTEQEYKAAVMLYTIEHSQPAMIMANTDTERSQNLPTAKRAEIDKKRKTITSPDKFEARCKEATAFFSAR